MYYKDRFNCMNLKPCICKAHDDDPVVQNGLAITPARMLELARQGIPISEQLANNAISYNDGFTQLDYEPELAQKRGTGLIELYEAERQAKETVKKIDFTPTTNSAEVE